MTGQVIELAECYSIRSPGSLEALLLNQLRALDAGSEAGAFEKRIDSSLFLLDREQALLQAMLTSEQTIFQAILPGEQTNFQAILSGEQAILQALLAGVQTILQALLADEQKAGESDARGDDGDEFSGQALHRCILAKSPPPQRQNRSRSVSSAFDLQCLNQPRSVSSAFDLQRQNRTRPVSSAFDLQRLNQPRSVSSAFDSHALPDTHTGGARTGKLRFALDQVRMPFAGDRMFLRSRRVKRSRETIRTPCPLAGALRRRAAVLLLAGGLAALSLPAPFAAAQDLEREHRLEAEIIDAILDGEPVRLDADGHSFLGIHTEAGDGGPRKAVIVLHGRGFHPDWPEVAAPLRTVLPEHGWDTLSLQMPVLGKSAKYYDYVPIFPAALPRIRAGIELLRARGARTIVLAAHSCSVHMAMAFVRRDGDTGFDGFIGIGMGATDYRQPMREPFPLASMSVPVLDLFGDEDYPGVLREAPARLAAIRAAGNPRSAQRIIPGAGHFFRDMDDELVDAVAEWLATLHDDP